MKNDVKRVDVVKCPNLMIKSYTFDSFVCSDVDWKKDDVYFVRLLMLYWILMMLFLLVLGNMPLVLDPNY